MDLTLDIYRKTTQCHTFTYVSIGIVKNIAQMKVIWENT